MSASSWPPLGPGLGEFADEDAYLTHCYGLYYNDFYASRPDWPIDGKRFAVKRQPEHQGRCGTFRHLTTEGEEEASRTFVEERCQRIRWPRLLLEEFLQTHPARSSTRIVWWVTLRRGQSRIVIALADFSYVVIIEDRTDYVLLWSAYPVEYDNRRRKLEKEYNEYWKI